MSNSNAVGVIGIIIGLVGAALGGFCLYTLMTTPTLDQTNIKGTWYDEVNAYYQNQSVVWGYIPNLAIDFTINPGENLYIMFNCYARIDVYGYFEIHIDNVKKSGQMQVTADSSYERHSVALQTYIPASSVSASIGYGAHNITVYLNLDNLTASNYISTITLFAQTFT
ncbi:MAG: hypothetical protein JW891_17025 [Candidatus Lokiarchaeota archaeon]|nr:hypothetical protein [Candidatus Lokiarchaeota archaeon]